MSDLLTNLNVLSDRICDCKDCPLHELRTHAVPGTGNLVNPDIMFIGEGPGEDEDQTGLPFVGKAGQMLTNLIKAMGYERHQVYITNIVKCRPPENRDPEPEEISECMPFLDKQIEVINPTAIITLGLPATKALLSIDDKVKMGDLRGNWYKYTVDEESETVIPVMPTYHPSYIIRTGDTNKDKVWEDVEKVLNWLKD